MKYTSQLDSQVGHSALSAVNALNKTATKSTPFGYLAKGVKFASENCNKVVGGITLINILKAKNKEKEFFISGGGFAGMLLGEKLAKNVFNIAKPILNKGATSLASQLGKSTLLKLAMADKRVQFGLIALEGVLFVTASIMSWGFASKVGSKYYEIISLNRAKENAKRQEANLKKTFGPSTNYKYFSFPA